jgi:hypothetical protein
MPPGLREPGGKKSCNLNFGHLGSVPSIMKKDEAADPIATNLFRSNAVIVGVDNVADPVQFRIARRGLGG